jgi:ABC-type Zn uptake system ZnuABC Zn-binding protein ZnuA
MRVVATATQVADFARNIGGNRVQVTGGTYLKMVRHNTRTIVSNLSGA